MSRKLVGVYIGLFIGLLLSTIGGVLALATSQQLAQTEPHADGVSTTGQVIGYAEDTALVNDVVVTHYAPVFVYEDLEGRSHRVTDYVSTESRPLAVGSTVEVSYLPGDPDSVRRVGVNHVELELFGAAGIGVLALGVTIVMISLVAAAVTTLRHRRGRRPLVTAPLIS